MKSLSQYITESIDKSKIVTSCKAYNDLSKMLKSLGMVSSEEGSENTSYEDIISAIKKTIGEGPYYVVSDRNPKSAFSEIASKADIKSGTGTDNGFIDLVSINKEYNDSDEKKNDPTFAFNAWKLKIKNAMYQNKVLKNGKGLTQELDAKVKQMKMLFDLDPIKLSAVARHGRTSIKSTYFKVRPAIFIVNDTVVPGIEFVSDTYTSTRDENIYVFSDEKLKDI